MDYVFGVRLKNKKSMGLVEFTRDSFASTFRPFENPLCLHQNSQISLVKADVCDQNLMRFAVSVFCCCFKKIFL